MKVGRVTFVLSVLCLATVGSVANAETKATKTVRGQLSVSCRPSARSEGRYEYRLAGKPIPALSSECSPGVGTSYIYIEQVMQTKSATTVLVLEGVAADSQTVKVCTSQRAATCRSSKRLGGMGKPWCRKLP